MSAHGMITQDIIAQCMIGQGMIGQRAHTMAHSWSRVDWRLSARAIVTRVGREVLVESA